MERCSWKMRQDKGMTRIARLPRLCVLQGWAGPSPTLLGQDVFV